MQKKYLTNIGIMYAIGVLLVLYGHSCPYVKWGDCGIVGKSIEIIYYFHMPLFFFLAGFMFEYTKSDSFDYKKYILKKIKFLLVPYLFITLVAFVIKIAMNQYAIRPIDVSFNGFFHSLFYPLDNPNLFLWFLPTLFLMYLIAPMIGNISKNIINALILFFIIVLLYVYKPLDGLKIFNIYRVETDLIYFIGGMFINKYITKTLEEFKSVVLLFFFIGIFIILIKLKINKLNFLIAFFGIFVIIIANYLNDLKIYKNSLFSSIMEKYYQIYLLSWFFLVPVKIIFFKFLHINYIVVFVLEFTVALFGSLIVSNLLHKNKILKLLVGLK